MEVKMKMKEIMEVKIIMKILDKEQMEDLLKIVKILVEE
jgi:hypothetical protein